jgi:hypothetical protein
VAQVLSLFGEEEEQRTKHCRAVGFLALTPRPNGLGVLLIPNSIPFHLVY